MPAQVKFSNAGASAKAAQSNQPKAQAGKLNKVTSVSDAIRARASSSKASQMDDTPIFKDGDVIHVKKNDNNFSGVDDQDDGFHLVSSSVADMKISEHLRKASDWLAKQPKGTSLTRKDLEKMFQVPKSDATLVFKELVTLKLMKLDVKDNIYKKI